MLFDGSGSERLTMCQCYSLSADVSERELRKKYKMEIKMHAPPWEEGSGFLSLLAGAPRTKRPSRTNDSGDENHETGASDKKRPNFPPAFASFSCGHAARRHITEIICTKTKKKAPRGAPARSFMLFDTKLIMNCLGWSLRNGIVQSFLRALLTGWEGRGHVYNIRINL